MAWVLIDGQWAWITDVQRYIRAAAGAMFTPRLDAYRLYDSDAGEAASTPLENEDVAHDLNVDAGNKTIQVRVLIQETGGADGTTMDDFTLQYNKNGTGLTNVPTSDTGAGISAATAGLTNDDPTTNRGTNGITDGSGSFVAGEQSTDGIVDDLQLTASNFTELVFGVTFYKANVANNDSFVFSVDMTNKATDAVSPTVTIDKTPPSVTTPDWQTSGWW